MHRGRLKRLSLALLPALALTCALSVGAASAHGHHRFGGGWHHGFWGDNAVVAGTITSVGTGSFGANAYVVTPGAGNSGTTPTTTAATILTGSTTKVITQGQSGLTKGDDFYAVYRGVPAGTPLATLENDTPSFVYAYAPPTPEVEVKGVVTTAPVSGSDTFVATAYVEMPRRFHPRPDQGFSGQGDNGQGGNRRGDQYSYGGGIGGDYGFMTPTAFGRGGHLRAHGQSGSDYTEQGTPNTTITTDSNTKITIDGQTASVSQLAVGDRFEAVFDGTPSEPLATITATPALSLRAWAPPAQNALYAFVGTVSSTDTTAGSITVNVTASVPQGLFSGADTFTVGPQTLVLGNTSGSLSGVSQNDVVAGWVTAPSGESASTVESTPLQGLVDFPTSSSSASATSASIRRAEHRAMRLVHREKGKLARRDTKHGTHRK